MLSLPSDDSGLQVERNSLQVVLGETRRTAAAAREAHERRMLEGEAEAKTREAEALAARTRELSELSEQHIRREHGNRAGTGRHV